jgi:amino acid transporter
MGASIDIDESGAYGEAEFIFASIKVITITGMGAGFPFPTFPRFTHMSSRLDNFGNHPRSRRRPQSRSHRVPLLEQPGSVGAVQRHRRREGRFLGFWAVLTQAAFSFIGTEIVAVGVVPLSARADDN